MSEKLIVLSEIEEMMWVLQKTETNDTVKDTIKRAKREVRKAMEEIAEIEIREDWGKALAMTETESIARRIHWSFSEDDLKAFVRMHAGEKYRDKIEDLLEECNFHSFCHYLHIRDYVSAWQYAESL